MTDRRETGDQPPSEANANQGRTPEAAAPPAAPATPRAADAPTRAADAAPPPTGPVREEEPPTPPEPDLWPTRIGLTSLGVIAVLCILLFGFLLAHPAKAAPPTVQVDVEPDSLLFPTEGGTPQALVVLRNPSEETLRNVRLDCLPGSPCFPPNDPTAAPLKATIGGQQGQDLSPNGERVWTVHFTRQGSASIPSNLYLRVDYDWQEDEGAESVSRIVTTSVALQVREPESIEQLADVQVATSLESLNSRRQGKVYLVVTNTSTLPITAKDVSVSSPDFITTEVQALNDGLRLLPKQSRAIAIDVAATDPIQPGKHLLAFTVPFEWTKAGVSNSGSIVKTHNIDVSVLGESQALTLLGVPSFLFIPGFLAIATVGLIFKILGRPVEETNRIPKLLEKDFWALAITLSILAAWSYPWFLEYVLGEERRYYIESYGLVDAVRVWFLAVLAGILFCLVLFTTKPFLGVVGNWVKTLRDAAVQRFRKRFERRPPPEKPPSDPSAKRVPEGNEKGSPASGSSEGAKK